MGRALKADRADAGVGGGWLAEFRFWKAFAKAALGDSDADTGSAAATAARGVDDGAADGLVLLPDAMGAVARMTRLALDAGDGKRLTKAFAMADSVRAEAAAASGDPDWLSSHFTESHIPQPGDWLL